MQFMVKGTFLSTLTHCDGKCGDLKIDSSKMIGNNKHIANNKCTYADIMRGVLKMNIPATNKRTNRNKW